MSSARGALAVALALLPRAARAHSFASGLDPLGYLVEGALAVWAAPWLMLPVAVVGIALGLAGAPVIRTALAAFLAGALVGLAASAFVGVWAQVVPPLAVGLVVAVLAALVPSERTGPALPGLAALAGATVAADVLEGFFFLDVPATLLAGIAGAATLAVAAIALGVVGTRRWVARPWITILWRIVASWGAAIQVLYLAFILAA